jgi:hypothetical protein
VQSVTCFTSTNRAVAALLQLCCSWFTSAKRYVLYEYKRTNTDANAHGVHACSTVKHTSAYVSIRDCKDTPTPFSCFTCFTYFTSTQVQILTLTRVFHACSIDKILLLLSFLAFLALLVQACRY